MWKPDGTMLRWNKFRKASAFHNFIQLVSTSILVASTSILIANLSVFL